MSQKTRIARGCPPGAAAHAAGLGYDAEPFGVTTKLNLETGSDYPEGVTPQTRALRPSGLPKGDG